MHLLNTQASVNFARSLCHVDTITEVQAQTGRYLPKSIKGRDKKRKKKRREKWVLKSEKDSKKGMWTEKKMGLKRKWQVIRRQNTLRQNNM